MLRLFYKPPSGHSSYYDLLYSFSDSENDEEYYLLSLKEKREVNKIGNLEFSLPSSHPLANDLSLYKTYIVLADDDLCLFYGRISELTKDFNNIISVTCEGILGILYDRISRYWIRDSMDPAEDTKEGYVTYELNEFGYSLPSDLPTEANIRVGVFYDNDTNTYESENTIGSTFGSILFEDFINRFGGVFIDNISGSYYSSNKVYRISSVKMDYYGSVDGFLYINDTGIVPDYSETINDNPRRAEELEEKSFKFGLNMLDISKEYPITEIITGIQTSYVYNRGDEYNEARYLNAPVFDANARVKFGTITQYVDTSEKCDDPSTATSMAQKICNLVCPLYEDKLTIKGIDPHYINSSFDRIRIGDAVNCYSAPHSVNTVLQCLSYDIDHFNHENDSYVIGPYVPNGSIDGRLTESVKKQIGLI